MLSAIRRRLFWALIARRIARLAPASIGGRISFAMGLALAPLCLLGALSYWDGVERLRFEKIGAFEIRSLEREDHIRRLVSEVETTLLTGVGQLSEELRTTGDCAKTVAAIEAAGEWSTRARVVNRSGRISCGGNEPIDVSGRESWRKLLASPRLVFGEIRTGKLSGRRIMVAYTPIPGGGPEHFALIAGVRLDAFREAAMQGAATAPLLLLNGSGEVIAAADGGGAAPEAAEQMLPDDRSLLLDHATRLREAEGRDGRKRLFFTSALSSGRLWSVAIVDAPSTKEFLLSRSGAIAALPLVVCIMAVFAVRLSTRFLVTSHVDRLRLVAERVGFGDETGIAGRTAKTAPREFFMLEETLRDMSMWLVERNARLEDANDMQRRLLLEIHHRVKNSLQTISSLMSLEVRRLPEETSQEVRAVFNTLRGRMRGLAMVHQHLYLAERLDEVDLGELISVIVDSMHESLRRSPGQNAPTLSIADVVIDTTLATPVALFMTEAVGNAYKHGHPLSPGVRITLTSSDGSFCISVSNRRAPGGSDQFRGATKGKHLGVSLMQGFARQIGGEMTITDENETFAVRLTAPTTKRELFSLRRRLPTPSECLSCEEPEQYRRKHCPPFAQGARTNEGSPAAGMTRGDEAA